MMGTTFNKTAREVLIGKNVLTRYNNRTYRIDEILFNKNPESTFNYEGRRMSYVKYFKEYYNIDIRQKGQPLLLNR